MIYLALSNRLDEDKVTIKDAFLQYSLITNSMFIYASAAINAILGRYIGFVRTNKEKQKTGLWQVKWNILLAAICFAFSIVALYKAVTAGSVEQVRSYLPISLWLLFYAILLTSSIMFVGEFSFRQPASLDVKNLSSINQERQKEINQSRELREGA